MRFPLMGDFLQMRYRRTSILTQTFDTAVSCVKPQAIVLGQALQQRFPALLAVATGLVDVKAP